MIRFIDMIYIDVIHNETLMDPIELEPYLSSNSPVRDQARPWLWAVRATALGIKHIGGITLGSVHDV